MTTQPTGPAKTRLRTLVRLGRVSNLPTVWTNCLAGAALGTDRASWQVALWGALSMSVIYTGGMFLNDAFDRDHDARSGATRPIVAGEIQAGSVFALGFLQLLLGVLGVALTAVHLAGGAARSAVVSAIALVLLVVLYDLWHKNNPASPVLMAGCRALVYVTLGLLASGGGAPPALWIGSATVLVYVVGLTWLAKAEARGLDLHAMGGFATFIAGISLVDAALLAAFGQVGWAAVAVVGFPATLGLQRWVRGT